MVQYSPCTKLVGLISVPFIFMAETIYVAQRSDRIYFRNQRFLFRFCSKYSPYTTSPIPSKEENEKKPKMPVFFITMI